MILLIDFNIYTLILKKRLFIPVDKSLLVGRGYDVVQESRERGRGVDGRTRFGILKTVQNSL